MLKYNTDIFKPINFKYILKIKNYAIHACKSYVYDIVNLLIFYIYFHNLCILLLFYLHDCMVIYCNLNTPKYSYNFN